MKPLLLALACLGVSVGISVVISAAHAFPKVLEGPNSSLTIGQNTLLLNGKGVHRKFGFQIYELSLFLKKKSSDPTQIVSSPDAKYARMKFLRNLKAEQIRKGFRESYAENCTLNCDKLKTYLKQLVDAVPDMPAGKSFEFVFSKNRVDLKVQDGVEISVPNGEFGKILLLAWIGDKPPSKRVKDGVLGLN